MKNECDFLQVEEMCCLNFEVFSMTSPVDSAGHTCMRGRSKRDRGSSWEGNEHTQQIQSIATDNMYSWLLHLLSGRDYSVPSQKFQSGRYHLKEKVP